MDSKIEKKHKKHQKMAKNGSYYIWDFENGDFLSLFVTFFQNAIDILTQK